VSERCPSCGKELGDITHVIYVGRAVIVRFEVEEDDGLVEREHHCGDE
jgi:hypothetical protein